MTDDWLRRQEETLDENARRIAELKQRVEASANDTMRRGRVEGNETTATPVPRQFSLLHAIWAMTACAIVLSAWKYNLFAVLFFCPILLGSLFGHWRSGSTRGAIAGVFYAYFVSLLYGGGLAIVVFRSVDTLGKWPPDEAAGRHLLLSIVVASVVGGYIGGTGKLRRAR